MEQIHARNNRMFALMVFAISAIAYFYTMAPTVAFWDCGEYIAAGASLGVPHPPGNILFMVMLRVVSILFSFFKDIGYRMNFLVLLFSSATATVVYLIAVRATISYMGIPDTTWKRVTVYVGGIVAGLFCAFGSTFWFSAVEASEANPSMFFVALSTLLAFVWAQSKDEKRDRILLLLTYISFLGIGVHMYSMIVLPAIFLFVILNDPEKRSDWRLWITTILLGLIMKDLVLFIYIAPIVAVFTLVMSLFEGPEQRKWRFCFWMAFFAIVGFSCHLTIPIRSALDPIINENHPDHWIAFKEFLQRKQYGAEDMVSRMFWRRGSWAHQFGIEGHMGYGGFHITQFFHFNLLDTERNFFEDGMLTGWAKLIVYLIPTVFMFFAWQYLYKRNKNTAIYLIVLFVVTSIFITLYMNFADGTRAEHRDYLYWIKSGRQGPMPTVHREVRVRDYFWTAAFMFFGLWIGIGASAAMHFFYTSKDRFLRTVIAPFSALLFLASPALPMTQNWNAASRRGDFIPYDYAYNLLMSCEKDGVIFTNGDNDTFPLWALQEAYGVRRDVRIVNLSLLNTTWYIKQLKKLEPKVPISYTDEQIAALRHQLNPIVEPTKYNMPKAGIDIMLPTRKELNALRVQDQMVVNIVDANKWKKPIYFAVTVSDDNLMGLGPYLRMQGLVYRLTPKIIAEKDRLDMARTVHLLDNIYRFRGLGDGTARLNDTSEKLLSNYAASYIQIALSMRQPLNVMKTEVEKLKATIADTSADSAAAAAARAVVNKKESAYKDTLNLVLEKLQECIGFMPDDWRPRILRHEVLMGNDMGEEAEKAMKEALAIEPGNKEYMKGYVQALEKNGKKKEATEMLKSMLKNDADPWYSHATLAKNFEDLGMFDSAIAVMEQFSLTHPGDRRAASFIQQLKAKKASSAGNPDKPDISDTAASPDKTSGAEKTSESTPKKDGDTAVAAKTD
jgi:tetratricopeptide (TPR) repeat protein